MKVKPSLKLQGLHPPPHPTASPGQKCSFHPTCEEIDPGPQDFLPLMLMGKLKHKPMTSLYKFQEKREPPARVVNLLTTSCSLYYLMEPSQPFHVVGASVSSLQMGILSPMKCFALGYDAR